MEDYMRFKKNVDKRKPTVDREDFSLIEDFTAGYQDKLQEEECQMGALVYGSKNVIIDFDGKPMTRMGTLKIGLDKIASNSYCTSSGVLRKRDGTEVPIKHYDTYVTAYADHIGWMPILTGVTQDLKWGFDGVDQNSDNVNKYLMCNGIDDFYTWNGAIAPVSLNSSTTIKLATVYTGSATIQSLGFDASGTLIGSDGVTYTYTGSTADTFTGVTPSPTIGAGIIGVAQSPVASSATPKGSLLLITRNARLIMADVRPSATFYGGGTVLVSKTGIPTDFTFTPGTRIAGEGFATSAPQGGYKVTGLAHFEGKYLIFKNYNIQQMTFLEDINDLIQMSSLTPYSNNGSSDIGCVGGQALCYLGKALMFVSPTKVISTIQQEQSYQLSIPVPISDPIRNYLLYDCAPDEDTCSGANQGRAYFSMKKTGSVKNDTIIVRNGIFDCWDAPFEGLSISSFYTSLGKLYGTSHLTTDVVQFDYGTTDFATSGAVGFPIQSQFNFARHSFGQNATLKEFSRMWFEGEMEVNGEAKIEIQSNESGETISGTIKGTESKYFYIPETTGELGQSSFGVEMLGGSNLAYRRGISANRFRIVFSIGKMTYLNYQLRISTSNYFKVLRFGPDTKQSTQRLPSSSHKAVI